MINLPPKQPLVLAYGTVFIGDAPAPDGSFIYGVAGNTGPHHVARIYDGQFTFLKVVSEDTRAEIDPVMFTVVTPKGDMYYTNLGMDGTKNGVRQFNAPIWRPVFIF